MGRGESKQLVEEFEIERFALDIIDIDSALREEAKRQIEALCGSKRDGSVDSYIADLSTLLSKANVRRLLQEPEEPSALKLSRAVAEFVLGGDSPEAWERLGREHSPDAFVRPWLLATHTVPAETGIFLADAAGLLHARISAVNPVTLCGKKIKDSWQTPLPRGSWHQSAGQCCSVCQKEIDEIRAVSKRALVGRMSVERPRFPVLNRAQRGLLYSSAGQIVMSELSAIASLDDPGKPFQALNQVERVIDQAHSQGLELALDIFLKRHPWTRFKELFSTQQVDERTAKTIEWMREGFERHFAEQGKAERLVEWPERERLQEIFERAWQSGTLVNSPRSRRAGCSLRSALASLPTVTRR